MIPLLVAPVEVAEDDAVNFSVVLVPLVGPLLFVRTGDASMAAETLLRP